MWGDEGDVSFCPSSTGRRFSWLRGNVVELPARMTPLLGRDPSSCFPVEEPLDRYLSIGSSVARAVQVHKSLSVPRASLAKQESIQEETLGVFRHLMSSIRRLHPRCCFRDHGIEMCWCLRGLCRDMGSGSMQSEFNWSNEWEPHTQRRKQILEKYGPQIKELYGHDPWTAAQVLPGLPSSLAQ